MEEQNTTEQPKLQDMLDRKSDKLTYVEAAAMASLNEVVASGTLTQKKIGFVSIATALFTLYGIVGLAAALWGLKLLFGV